MVLHSRFAEVRRFYAGKNDELGAIPEDHAHPCIDAAGQVAVFHNGSIANYEDLVIEVN